MIFRNFDYVEVTLHSEKLKLIWLFLRFFVTLPMDLAKLLRLGKKKERVSLFCSRLFVTLPANYKPNMRKELFMSLAAACCTLLALSCAQQKESADNQEPLTVGNPYMPLWEHIPDGEPYVFEDPDQPGKYRVYVYGSHDDLVDAY